VGLTIRTAWAVGEEDIMRRILFVKFMAVLAVKLHAQARTMVVE